MFAPSLSQIYTATFLPIQKQNKQSIKQEITENRADFTLTTQLVDMAELISSIPACQKETIPLPFLLPLCSLLFLLVSALELT